MTESAPKSERPGSSILNIIDTELLWGLNPLDSRSECRGGYLGREVARLTEDEAALETTEENNQ